MGRRIKEEKNTKKHKGANIPKATGFFTKHHRLVGYVHYSTMFLVAMVIFLCAPGLKKYSKDADGTNLVSVYMNGTLVGTVEDTSRIDSIVTNARKRVARENTGLVLIKADIVLRGSTEIFGTINTDEEIEENVYRLMLENSVETKESAYEVKINRFTVKLKTADEVIALLEAAKNVYDTEDTYSVNLVLDPTRELDVLTTEMVRNDEKSDDNEKDIGPKRLQTNIQPIRYILFYIWTQLLSPLYEKCLDYALKQGKITISSIQRTFSVNFTKARSIYEYLIAKNPKWELTKNGVIIVK